MEKQSEHAERVKELREWCQGESLDEDHAILAVVTKDCEVAQIEETLETVKALGRVRVRGRRLNTKRDCLTVLCECREKLDPTKVPSEVIHPTYGDWPIIMIAGCPVSDEGEQTPVKVLLDTASSSGSAESIIRAVGDMLSKMNKPTGESSSYRRLRMFSGMLPPPAGEEGLDHWLDQARFIVEESDCSAREKRRRIMECLRGPALAVVKAVRTDNVDITPNECLDAIESAFGTAESGEDLYFDFRLLQQGQDEKLSDFLRRLEQSLTKVVSKGGIPASRVDATRVEQLLRGAIHAELMLVQLKLRERKQSPPKFLELLSEIRTEEEYAAARVKLNMSVHRVHANQDVDSKQMDIQTLKSELKEMKAMFASMTTKPSPEVANDKGPGPVTQGPVTESCENAEIAALKKQVNRLQRKMSTKGAKDTDAPVNALRVEPSRSAQSEQKPYKPYRDPEESICYRCGGNGHFANKCQNEENQYFV
ncbi:hypothetical protein AAFF_G00102510 [Aldrovandia affinis]|uniref:CCHC-type domain-containing protein n=1 Tax=Aldrovandia affinis TaxID=143900 RepID=A0AAD7WBM7_9TELE|nr:hypothetical protein AAFF_G00102510 [Aldrovandia affinis]